MSRDINCFDCGKKIGRQAIRCGSCAAKYRWASKEYRQKQAKTAASEERKHALSKQTKKAWARGCFDGAFDNEEIRAKRSEIAKSLWEDESYRENQAEARSDEEYLIKQSQSTSRAWERGDFDAVDYEIKREKWTGKSNPNWKPKASFECEQCGAVITGMPCVIEGRRFCSVECHGLSMRGENSPTWRGGISFGSYGPEFNGDLKQLVRERDNYTCQICGDQEDGRALDVHHIDYDKKNNQIGNLIALCQVCHRRTNHNRKRWSVMLKRRLDNAGAAPG